MLLFVLISGLAGGAVTIVLTRLLPQPWDALALLGLFAAGAGPWLLGLREWPAAYAGAAAVFLTFVLRGGYEYMLAASDAKVREIVRGAPRRVPSL